MHNFPTCSQHFPTFCLSVFQSFPTCFPSVFQGKKQCSRRCRPKIIATWQCHVTHPTPRVMAPWGRPRLCPPQAMDTSNLQAWTVELCSRFSFGEGVWAKMLLEKPQWLKFGVIRSTAHSRPWHDMTFLSPNFVQMPGMFSIPSGKNLATLAKLEIEMRNYTGWKIFICSS